MAVQYSKVLLMVVFAVFYTKVATQPMSLPNCQTKCGSVAIPFPFGITKDCSLDSKFIISCYNTSSTRNSTTYEPFLANTNQRVLNISLNGELRVAWPVASHCYAESSMLVAQTSQDIIVTHFQVSPTRNKLIVVGYYIVGLLTTYDSDGRNYTTGCLTLCNTNDDIAVHEPCSCENSIPTGHVTTGVSYDSGSVVNNHIVEHDFRSCGYAFVVEYGAYNFNSTDLKLNNKEFPVLLDWAVGNQTCQQAQKDLSTYACKADKSTCYDATTDRSGYLCRCSHGYRGNPYLVHGCQGIIYFLRHLYDSS